MSIAIDPTQVTVALSAQPGAPAIGIPAWPDPRGAPNQSAAVIGTLAMAVAWAHAVIQTLAHRLAALEILAAERAALDAGGAAPDAVARSQARAALALAAVTAQAATIEITPPPAESTQPDAPASALDGITLD